MPASNIEPLAREIAEHVYRRTGNVDPSNSPMSAEEVAAWVDAHWECAAAELEGGLIDDSGRPVPGANWELGLAAYRERKTARIDLEAQDHEIG
jgi:hypothetical protein